jgi:carotenoid cleavage dioxygenase-like enzyme
LLAVVEADAPYVVKLPNLETVGKHDYNGKLKHPFTAHPKVDSKVLFIPSDIPKTGEMMFFGYDLEKAPYVHYSVVSKSGDLIVDFPVTIAKPVMMHDFAVTEKYSILMVFPFTFDPSRVFKGNL